MSEQKTDQPHDARAVANYLLAKAAEAGRPVTPMQLIKLVYLAHGWMLGLHGRPLISDRVEAWQYGPVVRSVYGAVSAYRSAPIERPIAYPGADRAQAAFDRDERSILDQVFEIYGRHDGLTLSRLTHQDGSPWHTVWSRKGRNGTIDDTLIESHFKALAESRAR
jgi:uncharacterized phage-associated protein